MEQTPNNDTPNKEAQDSKSDGYLFYARIRIFAGIVAVIAVLWLLNGAIGMIEDSRGVQSVAPSPDGQSRIVKINAADLGDPGRANPPPADRQPPAQVPEAKAGGKRSAAVIEDALSKERRQFLSQFGLGVDTPRGVAFALATAKPLDYELNERWWGWRPNDIINVTDNVNNFQVGVLEVTRRTTIILTDRISRSNSADVLDKHLENAMNAFMISANRYWFPSAESKYQEGVEELKAYADNLKKGEARFYNRTDNLIPLLRSYEDIVGSCNENLVKTNEADGTPVSHFMADNYFFYAKGVASALHTTLQAILIDYREVLETRRTVDDMHQAIKNLNRAMQIDPIYITNADLSGILANHRANMASTVSNALSYLQIIITALST